MVLTTYTKITGTLPKNSQLYRWWCYGHFYNDSPHMLNVIQEYDDEVATLPIGENGRNFFELNKITDKYSGYYQDEIKTQKAFTINGIATEVKVKMLDGSIKKIELVNIEELNGYSYADVKDIKNLQRQTISTYESVAPSTPNVIQGIATKIVPNRKLIALIIVIAIAIIGFIIYKRKHK